MEPSLGLQTLSTKRSEPAFAFTRARPVDHQIDTPGPKYSPVAGLGKQLLSLNATAPVARFGTAKQRPEINDSAKPGPGAYRAPSAFNKQALSTKSSTPSFSMSSRHREVNETLDKLGPGQCREDSAFGPQARGDKGTAAAFSFTTATRDRSSSPTAPGPGAYAVKSTLGGPSIAMKGRHTFNPKPADVIGPGRCDMTSSFGAQPSSSHTSSHGFSMTARPHSRVRESAPPPGSYETTTGFGKQPLSRGSTAPAYTMSYRHAERMESVGPGPNANAPAGVGTQLKSDNKSAPAFSFGTSTRPGPAGPTRTTAPGPDAYSLPGAMSGSTGKSFSGRVKFGSMLPPAASLPGPGNYTPEPTHTLTRAPAYGFGTAKSKSVDTLVPGPGKYAGDNSAGMKFTGPAYSLSGRSTFQLKSADEVGPGRCRTDGAVGKQVTSDRKNAPGVIMAGRHQPLKPATEVPGPGAYGELKEVRLTHMPPPPKRNRRPKVVLA